VDGVDLAVISSRLNATVHSMMNTIFRSGRSGVLNSAHDFSCCIVSAADELVMGAESLPVHMMRGPDLISRAIRRSHPEMRRGDAFIHNSPYNGNSHAADHCMFVPVVDAEGLHRFSVLAKAHQADCGNSQPTTYMPDAEDVYAEGALLFDAVRAQSDYTDNADLVRLCRLRIRVPDQWWGDYLALLGAVRVGERRMLELGEELGWDVLDEFVSEWFDYSERLMSEAIAKLPSGTVTAASRHDPIVGAPEGVSIRVKLDVRADEHRITVDLRDNPDCLPNGLNLTESTSTSAAMIGIFNSIADDVPANAGSYRRLEILVRENCVVGIPVHPASCSTATSGLADRVANAVGCAFAELADGVGLAECGLVIPASAAVISGRDPRNGQEPFVNQFFLAQTGGAGTAWGDGWLTHFHVGCAGMLRRDSIEIAEMRHPLLVRQQRLIPDTEGAGRHRGAPSGRRRGANRRAACGSGRRRRGVTVIKAAQVVVLDRGDGITSTPLVTRESDPSAMLTTGLSTYPKGTGAPLHTHNCDEQVTVLAGTAEVEIEGEVTALVPFDSTYIPAGSRHAFRNTGDDPMTILWIYPTQHVTRTITVTGETVEHLSDKDMLASRPSPTSVQGN
jgi:N-methylhydantoinase B